MTIICVIAFFVGIFFLQLICGALYACLEKWIDKSKTPFIDLWFENVEGMLGFDDNIRTIQKEYNIENKKKWCKQ